MNTQSLNGSEYFLTFIDDKTCYTWVYILKHDQVFKQILTHRPGVENSQDQQWWRVQINEVWGLLEKKASGMSTKTKHLSKIGWPRGWIGPLWKLFIPCWQEGGKLPRMFWAEDVSRAVYLRNRSSITVVKGITTYDAMIGGVEKETNALVKQNVYLDFSKEYRTYMGPMWFTT